MSEENNLQKYLRWANEKEDYDHHLNFAVQADIRFFQDEERSDQWQSKIDFYKSFDVTVTPFFEAVYSYGKWVIEKDYPSALRAFDRFHEMELISFEKKWFWCFIESISQQISLAFKLGMKENLIDISKRIYEYLNNEIKVLKPNTIINLLRQFVRLLEISTTGIINELYNLVDEYLGATVVDHTFREHILRELIRIKRYQKNEEDVLSLHKRILLHKLEEADERSSEGKLLQSALLEKALSYSSRHVRDRTIEEDIKKKLRNIDYIDELSKFELPKEMQEDLLKAIKKRMESLEDDISTHIEEIKNLPPHIILFKICIDESIFIMDVEEMMKLTKDIMGKYPIQHIFSTTVDLGGGKRRILETPDEKYEYQLHRQLEISLRQTTTLVTNLLKKLLEANIISIKDIYSILRNAETINENDLAIIMNGIVKHFKKDYISSISILTPKIESSLCLLLEKYEADISSYSGDILSIRMLGGLLELPEIEKIFSLNFQYFLKLFLTADDSFNFRNRFAHGEVLISEFNETVSLLIIFIIIKIYSKTIDIGE